MNREVTEVLVTKVVELATLQGKSDAALSRVGKRLSVAESQLEVQKATLNLAEEKLVVAEELVAAQLNELAELSELRGKLEAALPNPETTATTSVAPRVWNTRFFMPASLDRTIADPAEGKHYVFVNAPEAKAMLDLLNLMHNKILDQEVMLEQRRKALGAVSGALKPGCI